MLKDFLKKNGWRYVPGAIFLVLCAWLSTRSPIFLGNAIDQIKLRNWEAFLRQIGWMIAAGGGACLSPGLSGDISSCLPPESWNSI